MGRRRKADEDEDKEPWREVLADEDDSGLADVDTRDLLLSEEKHFTLPSGQSVRCRNDKEFAATAINAAPYLNIQDQVGPEDWPHIRTFLQNLLLMEALQQEISDPRVISGAPAAQKELRSLYNTVQTQLNNFAKIDPLRKARGDDEQTTAEWRRGVMNRALQYAENHIGEFTWLARCPSLTCLHNNQPFPMLMEVPHFAFDSSAGPGVVWNEEIMDMVHLGYCREDCGHEAHNKPYEGRLSVRDAARILRVAAIGILAICKDRSFSLGIDYDLDQPETLKPFVQ